MTRLHAFLAAAALVFAQPAWAATTLYLGQLNPKITAHFHDAAGMPIPKLGSVPRWSSDDPSIAMPVPSEDGTTALVIPISPGSTTIRVLYVQQTAADPPIVFGQPIELDEDVTVIDPGNTVFSAPAIGPNDYFPVWCAAGDTACQSGAPQCPPSAINSGDDAAPACTYTDASMPQWSP